MNLELVQTLFDTPTSMIKRGPLDGRRGIAVKPIGDQTIGRFRIGNTVQRIRDDPDGRAVRLAAAILVAGIQGAQVRTVSQFLFAR